MGEVSQTIYIFFYHLCILYNNLLRHCNSVRSSLSSLHMQLASFRIAGTPARIASNLGAKDPGVTLGRVAPKTLKQGVLTFSLGDRH